MRLHVAAANCCALACIIVVVAVSCITASDCQSCRRLLLLLTSLARIQCVFCSVLFVWVCLCVGALSCALANLAYNKQQLLRRLRHLYII